MYEQIFDARNRDLMFELTNTMVKFNNSEAVHKRTSSSVMTKTMLRKKSLVIQKQTEKREDDFRKTTNEYYSYAKIGEKKRETPKTPEKPMSIQLDVQLSLDSP